MPNWSGKWDGGRTYRDGRRVVFVLEAMREGRRYSFKLEARNEDEALRELATFDRDPQGYRSLPIAPKSSVLYIYDKSIQSVLDWQISEQQAHDHIYATKLYLKQWAVALAGRDLNTLSLADLERVLDQWTTARKLRIVALKTFCTWHFKRGFLKNNPAALLEVPKSIAAKHTAPRHYSRAEVERAYAASDSQVQRDIIHLAAKSGLHMTEIERFAAGNGELRRTPDQGEIAGVIWVHHKSGAKHPNSLDAGAFAAATRIRERGGIPARPKRHAYAERVAERLEREKLRDVRPVQYGALRHSFITWARQSGTKVLPRGGGLSLADIRDAVGHHSTRTTRGYDGTEVVPMLVVPLNLTHPDDPPLAKATKRRR